PVAAFTSAPTTAPAPVADAAPPVIDEELRQVFLDEMDDEIASLRKHFPLWRADPEETENLKTVRRSFHTLKGSGRLVGALALGDFAWKIENMLNRVLDRSITASPPLLHVVGYAIGALPRFRDELSRHERSSFAMEGFSAAIDRLCAGDTSPIDESSFAAPAAPAVVEAPAAETAQVDTPVAETPAVEAAPIDHAFVAEAPVAASEPPVAEPVIKAPLVLELVPMTEGELPVEIKPPAAVEPPAASEPEHAAEGEHELEKEPAAKTEWFELEPLVELKEPVEEEPHAATAHFADTLDLAEDLRAAETHEAAEPLFAAAPETETPAEPGPAAASAPHVDQLLLEVLRSEADAHLAVVDAAVARGREAPLTVRDELVRAVHTLNGAFAMVEAPQMAHLLAPVESWLARSHNAGRTLDADGIAALESVSASAKQTLAALEGTGAAMPDTAELTARIVAWRDGVSAAESIIDDAEPSVADEFADFAEELEHATPHFAGDAPAEMAEPVETAAHGEVSLEDDDIEALIAGFADETSTHEAGSAEVPAEMAEFMDLTGLDAAPVADAPAHVSETPPVEADTALSPDDFEAAIAANETLLSRTIPAEPPVAEEVAPPAHAETEHVAFADEQSLHEAAEEALPQASHEPVAAEEAPSSFADAPSPEPTHAPEFFSPPAPAEPAYEPPVRASAPADAVLPVPDIDEDLLDIFVLEAQEILDRTDTLVLRLRGAPGDTGLLDGLRRDLHTIKGGANMSALASIGELGHAMESLLEGAVENGRELD
ncbi:MAG: Hpt domain-containing protein, partial [Rudaea sp.]|nr:Hpt domain-containing protein [Rudaea sp.]